MGKLPFTRFDRVGLELAEAGSGEVAGDAAHAEAVWPVWRDGDLDHRVVEPESLRRGGADLCVGGKLDDAGMLVGKLKLSLRQKHAVRLDAPDLGLGEREIDARHIASDRREHAFEACARVRRAANDLQELGAGIDLADLQLVGVRMLLGFEHLRHRERRERGRRIEHLLDLEPDAGERVGDLGHARACVEMVLEP